MKVMFLLLYFLALLVSIEGQIRKYPTGEALVQGLSNGTIRLLQWRANANPPEEIRGLTSFLGWTALALLLSFVVVRYLNPQFYPQRLSYAAFAILAIWSLFTVFQDYKKEWPRLAMFAFVAAAWPWILQVIGHPIHNNLFELVRVVLWHFGAPSTDNWIAALLSLFSLLSVGVIELLPLSIPLVTFATLWATTRVSVRFLQNKPIWLYHIALAYYVLATMYYLVNSELVSDRGHR